MSSRAILWRRAGWFGVSLVVASGCGGPAAEVKTAQDPPSGLAAQGIHRQGEVVGAFHLGSFGPRLRWDKGRGGISWLLQEEGRTALVYAPWVQGGGLGPRVDVPGPRQGTRFFEYASGPEGDSFFLIGSGAPAGADASDWEERDAAMLALLSRPAAGSVHESIVTTGQVGWSKVVFAGKVPWVIWTDRSRGDGAELWYRKVETGSAASAVRLGRGVSAWQVKECDGNVCVLMAARGESHSGLEWVELGPEGEIRARLEVETGVAEVGVLDFARTEHGWFLAYEAGTPTGPRIFGANYDSRTGAWTSPTKLTRERGAQRLRELHASADRKRIWAVWNEASLTPVQSARWLVGEPEADSFLQPQWDILVPAHELLLPLLSVKGSQLAGVTRATGEEGLEWFSTPGGEGRLETAALRLAGISGTPHLAWDLSCSADACRVLGALGPSDMTVFWATDDKLEYRRTESRPSTRLEMFVSDERVAEFPSLAAWSTARLEGQGPPSAGNATDRLSERVIVASLTQFDAGVPAAPSRSLTKDGRRDPEQAHLALRPLELVRADLSREATLVKPGGESKISVRARSSGGLALSELDESGGLLAWAALDNGAPHVFLTAVGPGGQKLKQVMVPHKGGDVHDVAVLRVESGFIVAWVETTDARADLFALHVDPTLTRISTPERLAAQVWGPSELVLQRRGSEVGLVFTADRESYSDLAPERRRGIFAAELDSQTGAFHGEPVNIYESEQNVHTLVALGGPRRGRLAWLEAEPGADIAGASRLLVAELPSQIGAQLSGLELSTGVTAYGASCDEVLCRFALIRREGDRDVLWGATAPLLELGKTEFSRVLYLSGVVPSASTLSVLDGAVIYPLTRPDQRVEIRTTRIAW